LERRERATRDRFRRSNQASWDLRKPCARWDPLPISPLCPLRRFGALARKQQQQQLPPPLPLSLLHHLHQTMPSVSRPFPVSDFFLNFNSFKGFHFFIFLLLLSGTHQLKIASYLAKVLELSSHYHELTEQPSPKLTKHLQACWVTLQRYIDSGSHIAPELLSQYQGLCVEVGEAPSKVFPLFLSFFILSFFFFFFFPPFLHQTSFFES